MLPGGRGRGRWGRDIAAGHLGAAGGAAATTCAAAASRSAAAVAATAASVIFSRPRRRLRWGGASWRRLQVYFLCHAATDGAVSAHVGGGCANGGSVRGAAVGESAGRSLSLLVSGTDYSGGGLDELVARWSSETPDLWASLVEDVGLAGNVTITHVCIRPQAKAAHTGGKERLPSRHEDDGIWCSAIIWVSVQGIATGAHGGGGSEAGVAARGR